MSKIMVIIVIVAVLGALGYMLYGGTMSQRAGQEYGGNAPEIRVAPRPDETAEVRAELGSIQTDGLDTELAGMEKEIAQ